MTREEIHSMFNTDGDIEIADALDYAIIKTQQEYQQQTCETCKFYKFTPIFDEDTKRWCCTEPTVSKFVSCPPKNFGCNQWRTK